MQFRSLAKIICLKAEKEDKKHGCCLKERVKYSAGGSGANIFQTPEVVRIEFKET